MNANNVKKLNDTLLADLLGRANTAYNTHINSFGNANVCHILNDPRTEPLRQACNDLYREIERRAGRTVLSR